MKHFELMLVHDLPVGRLLLACRRWGIEPREVLDLLAGCSPASTASRDGLRRIADALAAAGVDPSDMDELGAASPETAQALDRYLADHGWRTVTQYSPGGRALIEMPHVVLHAVRAAAASDASPGVRDARRLRDRVPRDGRLQFDELLADARACYGVRDDNVALTFMWPSGLVRRALLETGRRLAARGSLHEAAHVFMLDQAEITGALSGTASLATQALRRMDRVHAAEADGAPARLGPAEGAAPDPNLFPAGMAEVLAALMAGFELENAFSGQLADESAWTGVGAGVGGATYTGRACVAASAEVALARLRVGDVLITAHTTPAFEAVVPIAGALVTDHGGLMSHAALLSREHGIPAVIGVAGATTNVPDGGIVTVDPVAGRVTVDLAAMKEETGTRRARS